MNIRGFYRKNGFVIDGSKINTPEPMGKTVNSKLRLRREELSKLLDVAGSIRDRAIILLQYQTFQAVGEVCRLDYGMVEKGLKENADFIVVEMTRRKRRVNYHIVIGPEVIDLLRLYLDERQRQGETQTSIRHCLPRLAVGLLTRKPVRK